MQAEEIKNFVEHVVLGTHSLTTFTDVNVFSFSKHDILHESY